MHYVVWGLCVERVWEGAQFLSLSHIHLSFMVTEDNAYNVLFSVMDVTEMSTSVVCDIVDYFVDDAPLLLAWNGDWRIAWHIMYLQSKNDFVWRRKRSMSCSPNDLRICNNVELGKDTSSPQWMWLLKWRWGNWKSVRQSSFIVPQYIYTCDVGSSISITGWPCVNSISLPRVHTSIQCETTIENSVVTFVCVIFPGGVSSGYSHKHIDNYIVWWIYWTFFVITFINLLGWRWWIKLYASVYFQ